MKTSLEILELLNTCPTQQEFYRKAFIEGYNEALREFAWWADGVQFVGTCGTRLKDALQYYGE